MKIGIKYSRKSLVLLAMIICVFFFVKCTENGKPVAEESAPVQFGDFAGSAKCAGCHSDIYNSHIQTAHYLTATPAEEKFINGSFEKGKNTYAYSPAIVLAMEKRDSGLYQVAYFNGEEKKAMRFDMVIGSGVMGQSFLSWRNNRLYQLPITYFTAAGQWSNSPGFPSRKVMIDKPVTSRCLECHATFAVPVSGPPLEPMEFDHQKIIYGVDCEKCHGPAGKHIEFQSQNPGEKTAKFIVNPSQLSRQLQLDNCALCHSGNIEKTKPSFQFTVGKSLGDYFKNDTLSEEMVANGNVDVHGNQYGLMRASACFRKTTTLTCNTCHNPHENERGKTEIFSRRCMTCHNTTEANFKTPAHQQVKNIERNCIDCHMPALPSRAIAVDIQGEEVPRVSLIRSHLVKIYPNESKKYLDLKL